MNRSLIALLAGLVAGPAAEACLKVGSPPKSWRKTSANGEFVFVMRAADARDDFHSRISDTQREEVAALRNRYSRSGVYRADTHALVWSTDLWLADQWSTGPETVWVADDGGAVVWTSARVTAHPRHRGPVERYLFGEDQPSDDPMARTTREFRPESAAVIILSRGRPLVIHSMRDLAREPGTLRQGQWLSESWLTGLELDGSRLLVSTGDDQRLTFDLESGALVGRRDLVRWDRYVESVVIGLVVSVLVARLGRRRSKSAQAAEDTGTIPATP